MKNPNVYHDGKITKLRLSIEKKSLKFICLEW